jgi:hypothetical protein
LTLVLSASNPRALQHTLAGVTVSQRDGAVEHELWFGLHTTAIAVAAFSAKWPADLEPRAVEVWAHRQSKPGAVRDLLDSLETAGISVEVIEKGAWPEGPFVSRRVVVGHGEAPYLVIGPNERVRTSMPAEVVQRCEGGSTVGR